jgi:hypothetical protein
MLPKPRISAILYRELESELAIRGNEEGSETIPLGSSSNPWPGEENSRWRITKMEVPKEIQKEIEDVT